jgi:hypothetical protein
MRDTPSTSLATRHPCLCCTAILQHQLYHNGQRRTLRSFSSLSKPGTSIPFWRPSRKAGAGLLPGLYRGTGEAGSRRRSGSAEKAFRGLRRTRQPIASSYGWNRGFVVRTSRLSVHRPSTAAASRLQVGNFHSSRVASSEVISPSIFKVLQVGYQNLRGYVTACWSLGPDLNASLSVR